ncbi:MAG: serine hydrolase [Candidatus Omnitrophica bacterium]|nr:serine hydrolase [Candidatus Omnitrophota bacterium]
MLSIKRLLQGEPSPKENRTLSMKKNICVIIFLVIVLPLISIFSYQKVLDFKKFAYLRILSEKRKAAWGEFKGQIISEINKFKGDAGIVIKDLESGWEFAYQKDKLFPAASLSKIPIMAAAFLAAEEGKISLDKQVGLKNSDKLTGSGILKNMPSGTEFNVERLIGLMIYDSDNTATNMLTNLLGMDYLNKSFKEFSLKNTDLLRKIADYKSRSKGLENYTTSEDMASLLERIYSKKLISKKLSERCIGVLKLTRHNDRIPKYLPEDLMVAHKTGLERNVCHDVGIVFTPRGDFIICVLTQHKNVSLGVAKEFIARLSLLTYNFYEK